MANNEVLKSDDKFVHSHVDETLNGRDVGPWRKRLPVESLRRTSHRLHMKTIMTAATLAEKFRI